MDRFTKKKSKKKKSRGHKTRMTIIKQNRLNYIIIFLMIKAIRFNLFLGWDDLLYIKKLKEKL